jgi:hypothetical protein
MIWTGVPFTVDGVEHVTQNCSDTDVYALYSYTVVSASEVQVRSPLGASTITLTVDEATGALVIDNAALYANVTITGNLTVNGTTAVIGSGAKQTNVDAGVEKQMSMDDDYLYICTHTGTTDAVWKKLVMLQT